MCQVRAGRDKHPDQSVSCALVFRRFHSSPTTATSSAPSPVASLRTPLSAESVGPLGLRSHRGTPSRTPRAHSQLAADTQPVCSWLGEAGQGDLLIRQTLPRARSGSQSRASSDVQGYRRSAKAGSGRGVSGEPRNRRIHASGACTLAANGRVDAEISDEAPALPDPRRPSDLTRSAPASPHFCLPSTAARSGTRDPAAPAATEQNAGEQAEGLLLLDLWGSLGTAQNASAEALPHVDQSCAALP